MENESKATFGSASRNILALSAVAIAISANSSAVGIGTMPQSAKSRAVSSAWEFLLGISIRKKLETNLESGARPIDWIAARTVLAEEFAAPATQPSASFAATIRFAKYNGVRAVDWVSSWVTPLERRCWSRICA